MQCEALGTNSLRFFCPLSFRQAILCEFFHELNFREGILRRFFLAPDSV